MEHQKQKWVNFIFVFVSALVGLVVFVALDKISILYSFESKLKSVDLVIRVASIFVGGLCLLLLQKNKAASVFMGEVVSELGRVTWPTVSDTRKATGLVVLMVVISGLMLGGMDSFLNWLMKVLF